MSTTRKVLRQAIIRRLYSPHRPTASATTSGGAGTTDVIDTILAPAGMSEDFVRAWVYVIEAPAVDGPAIYTIVRCTAVDFSGSNTFITIDPAFSAAIETAKDYEIHYVFHPDAINDLINDIIRDGSRSALSAMSVDGDTTIFERDLILDGALYVLKRRLALRETGQESFRLKMEARLHESNYRSGLIISGYQPLAPPIREEENGNE